MAERRKRLSRRQVGLLEQQIYDVLAQEHPQSVRHVFYRMTDPGLPVPIPKTEQGYKRVQQRLVRMRRSGAVPYGWITDATRLGYHVQQYDDMYDFIKSNIGLYRQTLWTDELPTVEVWVESRSLAGVLHGLCRELAVSLYPTAGFSSASLCYDAAQQLNNKGRRVAVLYCGDYDPAGMLIDRDVERQLRRHLTVDLEFHRLAVTESQIALYGLPTKPRKATEVRRPDIKHTVEAEAMPVATLRRIVRHAVESYLPPGRLQAVRVAERSERQALRMLSRPWSPEMDPQIA